MLVFESRLRCSHMLPDLASVLIAQLRHPHRLCNASVPSAQVAAWKVRREQQERAASRGGASSVVSGGSVSFDGDAAAWAAAAAAAEGSGGASRGGASRSSRGSAGLHLESLSKPSTATRLAAASDSLVESLDQVVGTLLVSLGLRPPTVPQQPRPSAQNPKDACHPSRWSPVVPPGVVKCQRGFESVLVLFDSTAPLSVACILHLPPSP